MAAINVSVAICQFINFVYLEKGPIMMPNEKKFQHELLMARQRNFKPVVC